MDSFQYLALIQGGYYFISGIWPLIHMTSFMAVTGPKTDQWLVNTVGLLLAVIGAVLMTDGILGELSHSTLLLASGSAAALGIIEIVYVAKKTISKIYLLDTVIEAVFVLLWWTFLLTTYEKLSVIL